MRLVGLYVFTFVAHCSADYYFGPGDVVDGAGYNTDGEDIYMSDGDIYREYWPMDSGLYPGQAAGGAGLHQWPKCIDIPSNLTLCQNLRYNQMRLPNLLEHDTIREVTQQAKSWVPLVGIRCHPDTKLFLCSLFSPVCLDRPIWPCRSLCSAVKMACEGHMNAHGYSWPDMLRCDKFPLDNDLCIGLQNDMKPGEFCLVGKLIPDDILIRRCFGFEQPKGETKTKVFKPLSLTSHIPVCQRSGGSYFVSFHTAKKEAILRLRVDENQKHWSFKSHFHPAMARLCFNLSRG